MTFSQPTTFREALRSRQVKSALPTTLSSRELSGIQGGLLERSVFSARVTNAGFLGEFDDLVQQHVEGTIDRATMRLQMKQYLDGISYQPTAGDEGTIKDLSSDARLNLILKTNSEQAQGYGWFAQGQNAAVLDQWPCQELVRIENRKEERNWRHRWEEAAKSARDMSALQALGATGRMVARKDSGIWEALGNGIGGFESDALKTPYPPYAFNSGMGVEDVDRDAAIALGLIDRDTPVTPQDRGFNESLRASPDVRSAGLRAALLDDLGPDYRFDGDALVQASPAP